MNSTVYIGAIKNSPSPGVVLIEILIGLPLLLLVIWFFIYIGIMFNARTSMVSAIENALRTGLTRSNLSLSMADDEALYKGLDSLCSSLAAGGSGALDSVLFSDISRNDGIEQYNIVSRHWSNWYQTGQGERFCEQPLHNIYAIIFTQLALENAVGASLKFPCDPYSENKKFGAGCLRCIPLNPCTLDRSPVSPHCSEETIFHRVAIECQFRPASIFVAPLDALVNLITGSSMKTVSVISHQAFFEIPNDINWN